MNRTALIMKTARANTISVNVICVKVMKYQIFLVPKLGAGAIRLPNK